MRHPFPGDTYDMIYKNVQRGYYEPLSCDSFSPEYQVLLSLMLQKNPRKRPSIDQILLMNIVVDTLKNLFVNIVKKKHLNTDENELMDKLQDKINEEQENDTGGVVLIGSIGEFPKPPIDPGGKKDLTKDKPKIPDNKPKDLPKGKPKIPDNKPADGKKDLPKDKPKIPDNKPADGQKDFPKDKPKISDNKPEDGKKELPKDKPKIPDNKPA